MNTNDDGEGKNKEEIKNQLDLSMIRQTLKQNGYTFLSPIGKGGFSSVFLVFSIQYNLEFVVKVSTYKSSHKSSEESNEFDLSEINHLINLNHRNIISMYKYFTDSHYLYIVLEYCEGGSLKDQIQQNGKISSRILYQYCYQILKALKHCHDRKIAHNDIKPANVLIDKNQRLKLADFGLSKGFSPKLIHAEDNAASNNDDHQVGKNGEILIKHFGGSRPYMAPELLNLTAYDPFKADIWSLGVTFYELATGHLPWKTNDLEQMRLQISVGNFSFQNLKLNPRFCKIIHRMLEVIPSKRPKVDWLLEQSIFTQNESPQKIRMSQVNKSISNGTVQANFVTISRMRSNERFRNFLSFSSDSTTINTSENDSHESEKMSPDNEKQSIPTSFLKPPENPVFVPNNEKSGLRTEFDLKAKPRSRAMGNVISFRSSLPLQKTFL